MDGATNFGLFVAGIGLFLTAVGLFLNARQLRASQRVAAGEFLLHFDEMLFQQHDEVHQLLRPGGAWAKGQAGPVSADDWIKVERYMGMFERIKVLLDYGLLEINTVDSFYGYRIMNIVANEKIVQAKKLLAPDEWRQASDLEKTMHPWKHFNGLWYQVAMHREKR